MGKARKTKLKEYKPPRTSHYIVVANPLPVGAGLSDARFHDNLGTWLEWLTVGKKAISIFHLSKMSSVVVELPGQMTDELAARLLGEHALRDPRTRQAHYSQVFEYDYKKYGCPDEIQRCSRGSYSVVAPQKLDLPRPRECAFNPNVRFAKPNPRRAQPPAEADHDPPLQLDHHQLDNDRVAEQPIVKRDPYEEDDRHQLELRPAANIESERPPPDVPPEAPTTSRWQPYETPLENRARVGSRAPEHDVFSSRVQRTDVKPEPMDVDLPPSTHQTEVVVKDEEPENRDNSPEAGSAEYYRRALEQAEREVGRSSFKEEEPQDGIIVKREPREETVPRRETIRPTSRTASFTRPGSEEESIKQEPSADSIPTRSKASERQPSVKQEPRDSLHGVKPEPSSTFPGRRPPRPRSPISAPTGPRRPPHSSYHAPEPRTRYSPSRDPRRSATLSSDVSSWCSDAAGISAERDHHMSTRHRQPGNERKRGYGFTGRDGVSKRVKTEYEEY